jgi:hypothetical protein
LIFLEIKEALNKVDTARKDVEDKIEETGNLCGYRFEVTPSIPTVPIPGVSPSNQGTCDAIRSGRRTLSLGVETELLLCKTYMPEGECKACLAAQ